MTAWFAGCLIRPVDTPDGILTWERIAPAIRPLGPHAADTGCIELENTHNMAGGTVYPPEVLRDVCTRAHALGLRVHLDGARIFNAAVACGTSVRELCEPADTVMFCLSKALGAPVGSILAGPRDLIAQARLYRKRLGGGMRQAGVLAAAGLVALEQTPPKLAEDHANARLLAEGLANLRGVRVEPAVPATNIVIFDIAGTGLPAAELSRRLKQRGVLINPISPTALRAVTHYDVSRADCVRALEAIAAGLAGQ